MSEELTLSESIAEKLKAIKGDVTPDDRKDYIREFDSSKSTVSLYLDGSVLDIDKGIEMYLFFKKKIDEKKEKLANA